MSNTVQYRYFHKGDNEWLADPSNGNSDDPEWQRAWEEINEENKKAGHEGVKIEFTEDMYMNSEYGDTPEWVNVEIKDSGVLPFKMARGIVKGQTLDGLRSMIFTHHFDVDVSSEWGGWSNTRLEIYDGGAYLTLCAKHSTEEIELNITEQFNQAIGEV